MAIINLYPPIVDTYMPAFLLDSGDIAKDTCKVYFSLSMYNTPADIANVQVIVNSQETNMTMLNSERYPCGIMITSLKIDSTRPSDDKYYITITKDDMNNNQFEINQHYKVQLRFTAVGASAYPTGTTESGLVTQPIDSWLNDEKNLSFFSEWSTVCLIRGISTPRLSITGLDPAAESTLLTSSLVDIVGKIVFDNKAETDFLKSYKIKITDENNNIVVDSGLLYTDNYVSVNEFNYTVKYGFIDGETYTINVEFTTDNLYIEQTTFSFVVIETGVDKINAEISAIPDNDNGRIGIKIENTTGEGFIGNITIRRTSSESNFTLWDDVITLTIEDNQPLNVLWYDYTVKSGIWYKYCMQKRNSVGTRGIITSIKEPVLIMFEDMFLTAENQHIKIKYNPVVSSMKRVVSESVVNTIGSKYPFIKRNTATNYRQFPISGTITHFMDENKIFISKEELFNNSLELYEDYNYENGITEYNDYIYEREFRDKISNFLYKHNVKLFRSLTEGNILVKLTDISMTPEQGLGRYVYSFSCTASEIADDTIENYDKYNVQPIGTYDTQVNYTDNAIGQYAEVLPANVDLITQLTEKYQQEAREGYQVNIDSLSSISIEFQSEPYLIGENESGPYPIAARSNNAGLYSGYIVYINNEPVVITTTDKFELDKDVPVYSLYVPQDTNVLIDYFIELNFIEDTTKLVKNINYYKKVGQLWGVFNSKEEVNQMIFNKYYENYSTYTQVLVSIDNLTIEADPGTILYIKDHLDSDYEKHIIGPSCLLDIGNEDNPIEKFYFSGIQFVEQTGNISSDLPLFVYNEQNAESIQDIVNPIENNVYTINNGEKYIWYNNQWFIFTSDNTIECPVSAIVNYTCEIMKGIY